MNAPTPNMDKAALALHGSLDGGAAPKLSKSLAKEISQAIAKSRKPLYQLCQEHPNWPSYDQLRMQAKRLPWLHSLIWDARMDQADFLVQDNARLSEELLQEQEPSMARVQARKIVMEDRRWYASKVLKRVYGDDPALSVNTQVNVSVPAEKLASIRKRLEAAKTLVPPQQKATPAIEDTPAEDR